MPKRKEFIFVGRTSEQIAEGIIDRFGDAARNDDGKPTITKPGRVIQFEVSAFEDGEVSALLFANGLVPSHPIDQSLSEEGKRQIAADLAGANVTMVHSMSGQNTSIRAQGLTFLIGSLYRDHGVNKVRVIAPSLPYMRSDRNFRKEDGSGGFKHEYNAVASREFAKQLYHAGVKEVIGFEPHSRDGVGHYRKIFGKRKARFINMGDFFAEAIKDEFSLLDENHNPLVMVGSPDGMNKPQDFGIARARTFGERLYAGSALDDLGSLKDFRKRPYMFGIHKERISPKETKVIDFHGDVRGKVCIIIDDIISGGSTTLLAAQALKERGALKVIALATHGVLVNGAVDKLLNSKYLDQVRLTDTVPGVLDKLEELGIDSHEKLIVQTISPLVNKQIERVLGL